MSMVQEKMYMDVDDVCAILGVSKTYAYSLMREYNKELKAKGYIVVAGKISTKFLAEKAIPAISIPTLQRSMSVRAAGSARRAPSPSSRS